MIPDFIPVAGYLDDAILLPLAIMLAVRLAPPNVMAEHRAAAETSQSKPVSRMGVVVIVSLWLAAATALARRLWPSAA